MREKKLKYKDQVKRLLLINRRLIKQNNIAKIRAVRFKAKLDEARRNVPIRFLSNQLLKSDIFIFCNEFQFLSYVLNLQLCMQTISN